MLLRRGRLGLVSSGRKGDKGETVWLRGLVVGLPLENVLQSVKSLRLLGPLLLLGDATRLPRPSQVQD